MSHSALNPEQFDDRMTDWHQFDTNRHYRMGRQEGFAGDMHEHEHLSAKAGMGMPLEPHEVDYMAGHTAGVADARLHAAQPSAEELFRKHGVDKDTHDWELRFRESPG